MQLLFMYYKVKEKLASANKSLGKFDLTDIPPAPRGQPQIEVSFDIDSNGILHVSAKNKVTKKKQSIVIKASGGLTEDEIQDMIKDSEKNKDADKKLQDLVNAKNQADSTIYSVEKSLKELKGKIDPSKEKELLKKIEELKKCIKNNNKEEIEKGNNNLMKESSELLQKMYQNSAPNTSAQGNNNQNNENNSNNKKDDTIDGKYEEVKKNKK